MIEQIEISSDSDTASDEEDESKDVVMQDIERTLSSNIRHNIGSLKSSNPELVVQLPISFLNFLLLNKMCRRRGFR